MNLLYQYWTGDLPLYAKLSSEAFKKYADSIGAEYRFDHNPNFIKANNSAYYNAFRPLHDEEFHQYNNVLYLDMDVFPVDKELPNIFDQQIDGVGMCQEPHQPELRSRETGRISSVNDEKWALALKKWNITLPRDEKERLLVFNSGVVLYSQQAMKLAKKHFIPFNEYQSHILSQGLDRFYALDQNYLHANLFAGKIKHTEMPWEWNTQIHYLGKQIGNKPRPIYDPRNEDTKYVHIQLRGRKEMSASRVYEIVNKPQSEWL